MIQAVMIWATALRGRSCDGVKVRLYGSVRYHPVRIHIFAPAASWHRDLGLRPASKVCEGAKYILLSSIPGLRRECKQGLQATVDVACDLPTGRSDGIV